MRKHNPQTMVVMGGVPARGDLSGSIRFNVKILRRSLLEEATGEAFWDAFSQASAVSILFDAAALDLIAEQLEHEPEGYTALFGRFFEGRFRPKSKAPDGVTLGNFGESLAYVLAQCIRSNEIPSYSKVVRIVTYQRGDSAPEILDDGSSSGDTSSYPTPDFWVQSAKGVGVLEIKSTNALNYHTLLSVKTRKFLQPCDSVEGRRQEALSQLGHEYKARNKESGTQSQTVKKPQKFSHHLVTASRETVPFPANYACACGVLVFDGRVRELQTDVRFRTPPACRKASRACWECLRSDPQNTSIDVAVVWMENMPGFINLLGAGDYGESIIAAYDRWQQAIWSRHPTLAQESARALEEALRSWVSSLEAERLESIRAFWKGHIQQAMTNCGIEWDSQNVLDFVPAYEAVAEPVDISEFVDLPTTLDPWGPLQRRAVLDGDGKTRLGAVLTVGDGVVEYKFCGSTWNKREKCEDEVSALRVLSEFMLLAFDAVLSNAKMRPIEAKTGDESILLGWKIDPHRSVGLWYTEKNRRKRRKNWHGVPRTQISVLRDGRLVVRYSAAPESEPPTPSSDWLRGIL